MDTTRAQLRRLPFPLTLVAGLMFGLPAASPASDALPESLRIADHDLNAIYRDVRSRVSGEQRRELLRAQRNWLGYRDTVCARESVQPDAAGGASARTRCQERLTKVRTSELQVYGQSLSGARQPSPLPAVPVQDAAPRTPDQNCPLGPLPDGSTVHAVGIYGGDIDTDVRLQSTSHETHATEVVLNQPGEDVVLVLMAYEPVLWTIRRTPETRLAAVLVGGYYAQAVLGVERGLPLAITTHAGPRKDCGSAFYAYKAGPDLLAADASVQALIGRPIDRLWSNHRGGRIHIGAPPPPDTPLLVSDDYRPEDYTDLPPFPPGQRGLDRLIEMGRLRIASASDINAWVEAASAPYRRFDPALKIDAPTGARGTYVILGPMDFPAGLYGGNSAAFLLPPGVPMPGGQSAHSTVYLIEDGSCRGPMCPQHR